MKPPDLSVLARVKAPVDQARGLPNAFYTDSELFEQERARVFNANWACVGFAKDVAEPGDATPVTFLGAPLLVVRARDGVVRVFQNVCRHRGMILVEEPRKLKGVIRCPYHAWCYELDGRLRATPHVGGPGKNVDPSINRSELGLVEVRSKVWMDLVFVNLSGDAPDFEDHAGELIDRWAEFADRSLVHCGPESSFKLDVQCNWKLAVENYCESYHLPWVHPGLNSYSRLEDHYNIVERGRFSGQGTTVYDPRLDEGGRRFPTFADLPSKWNTAAEYVALYPNVLLGVHRDQTFAIVLEPVGVNRTIERVGIYYAEPRVAENNWDELRCKNAQQWRVIFEEDIFVVEGMQRGRQAPGFDGGKFSPAMDDPTHCFHHWVASQFET